MKTKGFTLIELLAVIVILAIIALIATPIILNIINDARRSTNERSIEMYASAVKNAIASYQLKEGKAPTTFEDLKEYITYEGAEVVCETSELNSDGSIYLASCKVGNTIVEGYTYRTKKELSSVQVYKPQYYSWSSGKIGYDLPSDAETTVTELNPGYSAYLGLDVDSNNKVTAAYVCFTRNETEYCLKGYDTEVFATNNTILEDAFKDVENACSSVGACFHCGAGGLNADSDSDVGHVYASAGLGDCYVYSDGSFECYEL